VRAQIVPGSSTAYVADRTVLLVRDPVLDADLIRSVAAGDELANLLPHIGARDFVAVQTEGSVTRVLARGAVEIVVHSSPSERIALTPELIDRSFTDLAAIELLDTGSAAESRDSAVDIWAGAAPASMVMWTQESEPPPQLAVSSFDRMFGATVPRSVEDAAVRDFEALEDRRPLGLLVFSSGDRVLVDQPMLLGRNPVRRDVDAAETRLVKLPGVGLSRTHASITIDRCEAVVDDLGSLNGTLIAFPGRSDRIVEPGSPVSLSIGARVRLGDDVCFEVEEVA
jgi:hypothetical protein